MKTFIYTLTLLIISNIALADSVDILIELSYTQKSDNSYILKSTIIDEEDEAPVSGIDISYSVIVNGETVELGSSKTTKEGISIYNGNLSDLRTKGHQFKFIIKYIGSDEYSEASAELDITDTALSLRTEIVDSVNTVFVVLSKWNEDDESVPISDEDIKLFVPRMYSLLPITEAYTSEEGTDEVEFPNDLPGGPAGELAIIAKLEEHEEYGTIEFKADTKWGLPVSLDNGKLPRALWSPDAPFWMVITFIILMTGVWGHYIWIIYSLFRIKRFQEKDSPINYAE